MPAQVIKIGEPQTESERRAIKFLKDNLPSTYTIFHNFEIKNDRDFFEIDLAIITPHAVYLVDAKHIRGKVTTDGQRWYPEGRAPFPSPLPKIRNNARILKGLLTNQLAHLPDLSKIFIDGIVLITSDDFRFIDQTGKEESGIIHLDQAVSFFTDPSRVPDRFHRSVHKYYTNIQKVIKGSAQPPSGPLVFGEWQVTEELGSTDAYTDYRAFNRTAGKKSVTARLRVYNVDQYLPEDERKRQQQQITRAYSALSALPSHPNIISVRTFFATEDEEKFVLVTEDLQGDALHIRMNQQEQPITLDQKIGMTSELLNALSHAHSNKVIHRNLSPSAIIISPDGHLHLTGFEYSRVSGGTSQTIADRIKNELDLAHIAPEVKDDPSKATPQTDLFSAGLIIYELFTGEKPFADLASLIASKGVLPDSIEKMCPGLPKGFDDWLSSVCRINPKERLETAEITRRWNALINPAQPEVIPIPALNYADLPQNTLIMDKYSIERKLGKPGSFGVVYKVIDTFADQPRAIKFLLHDRHSPLERIKVEYRTIQSVPEHIRIVKAFDAALTPDRIPYIVFEFIDGQDLGILIEQRLFSPEDVLSIAKNVAEGLAHLHQYGVFHCDIKPGNLIWTTNGVRIIDFNVSSRPALGNGFGGGTKRYLPPDLDLGKEPDSPTMADRDLYALGITLYEALTGKYPWDTKMPPLGIKPKDPSDFAALSDLTPAFTGILLKLISPEQNDRFESAAALVEALNNIPYPRKLSSPEVGTTTAARILKQGKFEPDTNPFVDILLTFYSQSITTNAGTRGLDDNGKLVYIETALDRNLRPAVINGEFNLVIITGNAGDGKTAFLQQLEEQARRQNAPINNESPEGVQFSLNGHRFLINYDGSQDQGNVVNDKVLEQFFNPFSGIDSTRWGKNDIRLIAINEGRLRDFLITNKKKFLTLSDIVDEGLKTGKITNKIAVINLNNRSIVATSQEDPESIFVRLIKKILSPENWNPCESCTLNNRCYIRHNILTLQDETAGPQIIHRLETLYKFTHLRGQTHITLRDLRSALAYLVTSNRTCQMIKSLYESENTQEILQSYYYSSWMGGDHDIVDRLLKQLSEIDIGKVTTPQIDRRIDFSSILSDQNLFNFSRRDPYEREILTRFHSEIPRDLTILPPQERIKKHRDYLKLVKRRLFFERRDESWRKILPYRHGAQLINVLQTAENLEPVRDALIRSINRGEGISYGGYSQDNLVLKVSPSAKGSIRSYRVFSKNRLSLNVVDQCSNNRFIEHMPANLQLNYENEVGLISSMAIDLDTFEMLSRLNEGYVPTVEQMEGYCLRLEVFKNILSSAPYQEILLTITGHEFYQITRLVDGRLKINTASGEMN